MAPWGRTFGSDVRRRVRAGVYALGANLEHRCAGRVFVHQDRVGHRWMLVDHVPDLQSDITLGRNLRRAAITRSDREGVHHWDNGGADRHHSLGGWNRRGKLSDMTGRADESQFTKWSFLFIGGLMALDFYTKYQFRFATHGLELPLDLIEGYVYLDEAVFNYGTGWFSSEEPSLGTTLARLPYIVINIVFSIWWLLWLSDESSRWIRLTLMLLLAGALANLLDMAVFGNVCDWLALTFPDSDVAYVVNLADLFIYVGFSMLALSWETVWGKLIFLAFIQLVFSVLLRGLFW